MINDSRNRQDLEALPPWFATRKLDDRAHRELEEALKTDSELAAKLALVEEERDATKKLNESLGGPGEAAWEKIAAVVAAEPRRPSFLSHVAEFVGLGVEPKRGRLAFAGAAAAALIVAETAALVQLMPTEAARSGGGRYATATAPATSAGAVALIAFAPDARLDALNAFLTQRHASIVEGPRGGLYKARFGDKALSKAEMDALIKDLRAEPLVKLALPAGG